NKLADETLYLEDESRTEGNFEEMIGESLALRNILKQVETVAGTDSTVLIRGETGTGKELIAREIHNLSSRRERTLVKVNCAAIPMGLWRVNCLVMRKAHSQVRSPSALAASNWRITALCSWMKWATYRWSCNQRCLRVLQEQQFERLGSTRTQVQSFQARRHSARADLVRRHMEIVAERKRVRRFQGLKTKGSSVLVNTGMAKGNHKKTYTPEDMSSKSS